MGPARRRARWPLVGRDTEIDTITDALARGGAVVYGPAGVGRTRLVTEVAERAVRTGRRVHRITGSCATAEVPLGAAAHLLPVQLLVPEAEGAAVLAHAVAALTVDDPVVVVDDAHLLDPLTVGALDQLARSGSGALVAAVPDGPDDPLAPLWLDEVAHRIDLGPLTRPDLDVLLRRVVGGPVATGTREQLWGWSRGLPRRLREIVESGRDSGCLAERDGLWEWTGPLRPTPPLAAIVTAPLAGLDPGSRTAVDLLTVAGPLPVHRLAELAGRTAMAGLERAGIVEIRRPVDRPGAGEVHIADPLLAVVLAGALPAAEAGTLRRRIAESATGDGPGDALRTGRMLLDGEAADVDPAALVTAAEVALDRGEHVLAHRLATAAGPAGAAVRTEALTWLGRPADAAEAGRAAPDSPRLRAVRALNAELGLRVPGGHLLGDAADGTARATLALIALHRSEPGRAAELGRAVLDDPGARAGHPLAGAAAGMALAVGGQADPARAAVAAGLAALDVRGGPVGPALGRLACEHARQLALLHLGDVVELTASADAATATVPAHPAGAARQRGGAGRAPGPAGDAAARLVEAAHGLDRADPLGVRVLCDAWLATALALAGRPGDARDRLTRIPDDAGPFRAHAARARVWVEAGPTPGRATAEALTAAGHARRAGEPLAAAALLHDAVRIGRSAAAADPLHRLAREVPLPVVLAAAEHVAGVVAGDPDRIDGAADRFEKLGALLRAADAAAHAAGLHRSRGDRRRSAATAARAAALAHRCGEPTTPALEALSTPRLTGRETDVARLAAAGLSNQMIARRLVVSVRTVETHLAHTYAKLGVDGRGDLLEVLPPG